MRYWLQLFTRKSWNEFRLAGASVTGFRSSRLPFVRLMAPDDIILCYIVKASSFCGALKVSGSAYYDTSLIWSEDDFPSRIKVKPLIILDFDRRVYIKTLESKLSFFRYPFNNKSWGQFFRLSPKVIQKDDAIIIYEALNSQPNAIGTVQSNSL